MTALTKGSVGVYTSRARWANDDTSEAAAELDALGFDAAWVADTRGDLAVLGQVLVATQHLAVGTAVLSIWDTKPGELVAWWARVAAAHSDRMAVGLGVSHAPLVARTGQTYTQPLEALRRYLDELDTLAGPAPSARLVGANGPKMLELAGARTAGALTYLVTPERTAVHREQLGPSGFLAPEVKAVLAPDHATRRDIARAHLAVYLNLPNYRGNLLRMGFTEGDLDDGGSDRLVDALVAGPTVDDIAARVQHQRDAGADHVAVHVLTNHDRLPRAEWRELAAALCSRPILRTKGN